MPCSFRRLAAAAALAASLCWSSAAAQNPALQADWHQNPWTGTWYGLEFTPRSWSSGQALAQSLGGNLATVRSAAEQAWIESTAWAPYGSPETRIGLNDLQVEGTFVWSSGHPLTYVNWAPGQPDNQGGTQHTVILQSLAAGANAGKWDDVTSSAAMRVLLEAPARPISGWSWPRVIATGANPSYGTLVDIDGDGDLDYVSTDYDLPGPLGFGLSTHKNGGDGIFSPGPLIPLPNSPRYVAGIDHNQDGLMDLVASLAGAPLRLCEQTAPDVWTTVALGSGTPHGVAIGDLNSDGFDDVIGGGTTIDVHLGKSGGGFLPALQTSSAGVYYGHLTLADVDGDGDLDLVAAREPGGQVRTFKNDGTGQLLAGAFVPVTSGSYRVACADFDGDGHVDIAATLLSANRVEVWRNDGSGSFSLHASVPTGAGPHAAEAADFDGDGHIDLVVPCYLTNDVRVLWNLGTGTFPEQEAFIGHPYAAQVVVGDLNGDGIPDVGTARFHAGSIAFWLNQRTFTPTLFQVTPDGASAATGSAVGVHALHVPDGPVVLVLGDVEVPFTMFGGHGVAVVPPLAAPSPHDVVVDAYVAWGTDGATPIVPGAFRWIVPKVVSVTPSAMPHDAATAVVIELADNVVGSGFGTVRFGDAPAQTGFWFPLGGKTFVTTIAPPQVEPGAYGVRLDIHGSGVTETTLSGPRAVVALGPGIASMSATSGFQGGGESVTFELVDFVPGVPVDIAFGAATTSGVPTGFLASSVMHVVTPASPVAGVVDVTLRQTTANGTKTALSPQAFEFVPPLVGALSITSGPQAGGTAIVAATSGFSPGAATVEMGGAVVPALVTGSGEQQTIAWTTPAATVPGATDVRVLQDWFDVTKPAAYTYLEPSIGAARPSKGAWYLAHQLSVPTQNLSPTLPLVATLGGQPADATLVGDTLEIPVPAGSVAGAGPLAITVQQASVLASNAEAWTSMPSLSVGVAGTASSGGTVTLHVDTMQGGFAYLFAAASTLPFAIPLPDMHYGVVLDPGSSILIAAAGLLVQPTIALPFGAGALPPGLTLPVQALAFEFGALGVHFGFTEVRWVHVP